jgi:putative modified peptide
MSQAAVEKALGKLITDEGFRRRFSKDPAAACFAAGLELSPAELDALSRIPGKAIDRISARLDHRICRLSLGSLEEEGPRAEPGLPPVRQEGPDEPAGPRCCSARQTQEKEQ